MGVQMILELVLVMVGSAAIGAVLALGMNG
jgi:hypothetical protein